jgi:hypothetical protein
VVPQVARTVLSAILHHTSPYFTILTHTRRVARTSGECGTSGRTYRTKYHTSPYFTILTHTRRVARTSGECGTSGRTYRTKYHTSPYLPILTHTRRVARTSGKCGTSGRTRPSSTSEEATGRRAHCRQLPTRNAPRPTGGVSVVWVVWGVSVVWVVGIVGIVSVVSPAPYKERASADRWSECSVGSVGSVSIV